jgi:hypothetical protein
MRTRSCLKYGDLGLRSGHLKQPVEASPRPNISVLGVRKSASCCKLRKITVVPCVTKLSNGKMRIERGTPFCYQRSNDVGSNITMDVYLGMDWDTPPFDSTNGTVLRLQFAQTESIMHIVDVSITVGEIVAALQTATEPYLPSIPRLTSQARAPFDLDTLDVHAYDRITFDGTELLNDSSIGTYIREHVYKLGYPMQLGLLLAA